MCQLIEVTWFIWKLSADQLIVLLDREQCSISYFLASLGSEHRKTGTHIGQLSKQGIHWPVSLELIAGSGVDPSWSSIFWSYPLTRYWFSNDRRLKFIFVFVLIHMKYVVFMCPTINSIDFKLTSDAKIQPAATGREDSCFWLSHHVHALVTLYVQFLCSDWSKFDSLVHVENLCSILNLFYCDSWSRQGFVSTCDVFNCLFPLDVQNEIQPLSEVFCYSWLVCLLGFWLRN